MRELHANPGVCILAGDPTVRLAAAAADLRAVHAPRLPHPLPHQVGVRVSLHRQRLANSQLCPNFRLYTLKTMMVSFFFYRPHILLNTQI